MSHAGETIERTSGRLGQYHVGCEPINYPYVAEARQLCEPRCAIDYSHLSPIGNSSLPPLKIPIKRRLGLWQFVCIMCFALRGADAYPQLSAVSHGRECALAPLLAVYQRLPQIPMVSPSVRNSTNLGFWKTVNSKLSNRSAVRPDYQVSITKDLKLLSY